MSSLLSTSSPPRPALAVIQFCTRAFDGYVMETSVSDIFGGEIENLRGLGILFKEQVFLYCFFARGAGGHRALAATEARESRNRGARSSRYETNRDETSSERRRRQTGAISKHDEALDSRCVCKGNAFGGQVQSSRRPARRRGGETPHRLTRVRMDFM